MTGALAAGRAPRLICLMYHRLVAESDWSRLRGSERIFATTAARLDDHIRGLREGGFAFVSLEAAHDVIRGARRLEAPSILLSFDDGCRSICDRAVPVLREHGVPAVVFITTDPSSPVFEIGDGGDPRMTDAEIRGLREAGLAVGSHGVSHTPLSALPDDEVRSELEESRARLREIAGTEITSVSIPGNWHDARVLRMAREAGYASAWCSEPGRIRSGAVPWGLPRVNVEGRYDGRRLLSAISPAGVAQRRLALECKKLPKRLLGPTRWLRLRRRVLRWIPADVFATSRLARGLGVGAALLLLALLALCAAGAPPSAH